MSWEDLEQELSEQTRDAFGVTVTLHRVAPGVLNTATGKRAETVTTHTLQAVRGPVRTTALGGSANAQQVELSVVASDLTFTPEVNDRLLMGGETYTITAVARENSAKSLRLTISRAL